MKLGNFLGARDDYTRALEMQPGAELHAHRGWAYFFLDAWRPAWHDFDRAVRLGAADEALRRKPGSPEMMHNLACTFAQALARVRADTAAQDRETLAARYLERALGAVRQTLALVPESQRPAFWQTKVASDSALDP